MEKKIAIRGHKTRGEDVIKALEDLGGKNLVGWEGIEEEDAYSINDQGTIECLDLSYNQHYETYSLYTIEEYEALQQNMKGSGADTTEIEMKYKVGDKVKLKSKEGLDKLKQQHETLYFPPVLYEKAGSVCTISSIYDGFYSFEEMPTFWAEPLIEGLAEEETKPKDMGEVSDGYHTFNELYEYRMLYNAALFNEFAKQGLYDVHKSRKHSDGEYPFGDSNWFIVMAELPTGQISNHYEMKDWFLFDVPEKEVANVWDGHTPKDVTERLRRFLTPKSVYPKTYEECAKVLLDRASVRNDKGYKAELLVTLQKILVCRDAYWKIAGEEMGLGKPWEPDYDSGVDKFGIICLDGVVQESNPTTNWERHLNKILDFPTREMRDAFKENFKELIEQCKELL